MSNRKIDPGARMLGIVIFGTAIFWSVVGIVIAVVVTS